MGLGQVGALGAMATSSTGGLSGAFIPVSEDAAMAKAAADGSRNALAGVIADVVASGSINAKTAAAPGGRAGG